MRRLGLLGQQEKTKPVVSDAELKVNLFAAKSYQNADVQSL